MKVSQKNRTPEASLSTLVNVGASLRAFRLEKRMTHEQVSQEAGFSRQTLSRIERGDPSVAIGQVIRYAALVGGESIFTPSQTLPVDPQRRRVRRTVAERQATAGASAEPMTTAA